jgi:hypothetical protein
MTDRDRSGYGDEGGQRPSGRGAVTERLARQDRGNEIDLTDEATERESSGAFEPADAARGGSASIFDVDERARQEDENRTGYEPSVADADATPDGPRGATVVTEPGEAREEQAAEARDEPVGGTPAPVAEPPAEATAAQGPGVPATPDAATPDAASPAALLGSLDAGDIRGRFLDIQAGFIDEPRQAVEEAGRFVDDLLRQVAESLQQQRAQLTGATEEASTEDLRLTLRAYRQFVDRLLGLAS